MNPVALTRELAAVVDSRVLGGDDVGPYLLDATEARGLGGRADAAEFESGVTTRDVQQLALENGLYYPPDPGAAEQSQLGGNVATNAGGPHAFKYGVTGAWVTGLEVAVAPGELASFGRGLRKDVAGYDIRSLMIGSEGTLGIVTSVEVKLTRLPQDVRTLLVGFGSTDQAGAATSAIIAAGIVPAAIEMMDALAIEAAEAAVQCGYPDGAGAVLVIELDGSAADVDAEFDDVEAMCREAGAFEVRVATDAAERALIWRGRKSAFAAVGRISPDYIVQDGVIPRTALPEVLAAIDELSRSSGVRVANVFHAGDGNLHPLVLFDDAVEGAGDAAEEVSGAILDLCISHGGSITGEHGVGMDKAKYMPRMYTEEDLDTMQLVRCAFDPAGISNPGKVFPTPRLCGEVPGRHKGPHPLQAAGLAEVF
jgi:glycolate oxidase